MLKLEQYNINIHFIKSKRNFTKKLGISCENCDGVCFATNFNNIYIGVFDNNIDTLVHEIFHAVIFVNNIIEENIDYKQNNEHNAYLMEFIFKKLKFKILTK